MMCMKLAKVACQARNWKEGLGGSGRTERLRSGTATVTYAMETSLELLRAILLPILVSLGTRKNKERDERPRVRQTAGTQEKRPGMRNGGRGLKYRRDVSREL